MLVRVAWAKCNKNLSPRADADRVDVSILSVFESSRLDPSV